MAELYSIAGLLREDTGVVIPYGGFFTKNIESDEIKGTLVDFYGTSEITGNIDPGHLAFRKQYITNWTTTFDYKFLLLKNGIWCGEYSSPTSDISRLSICRTSLAIEGFDFRRAHGRAIINPERCTKEFIDNMVGLGMLERFEDPETGEEKIRTIREAESEF